MNRQACKWVRCDQPGRRLGYCLRHYSKAFAAGLTNSGRVDVGLVRERVLLHLDNGVGRKALAEKSGLTIKTICRIINREWDTVHKRTADLIMAVPVRREPTTIGCIRRVNALRMLGYSVENICELSGMAVPALRSALFRRHFTPRMKQRLVAAYDLVPADRRGPSAVAAHMATAAGHASVMAWEGIDIDDPTAVPDLGIRSELSCPECGATFRPRNRLQKYCPDGPCALRVKRRLDQQRRKAARRSSSGAVAA